MKNYIIILVLSLFISELAMSQDPYFSQYFASPMTLNPSLIGSDLKKESRFQMVTRNQWWGGNSKPYTTNMVSLEKRLGEKGLGDDQFVMGLMFLNERSNGGILSNSFFTGAINYRNSLDASGNNVLSGAISGSYSNRMLDLENATFQSQFGSFGFMQTASNYDPVSSYNLNNKYFDVNAGISYAHKGNNVDYEIGGALFHASKPKEGVFNNSKYNMDPRGVFNGSLKWRPTKTGEWDFAGNYQRQARKQLVTLGASYAMYVNDTAGQRIIFGFYHRLNESFYPYIGIQSNDLKFGVSYDIISGPAKTSFNSVQSVEATLSLTFGGKKKK